MNIRFFVIACFIAQMIISCHITPRQKKVDFISQNTKSSVQKKDSTLQKGDDPGTPARPNSPEQIYIKQEIPILCYHRIALGMKSDYEISPETFTAHMKILADSGYHSISPAQLYDYLLYNKTLPDKPVMITFDDSRIEHFEIAAPVMEKYGFRGVFFIMTITLNKKNYMSEEQIARLAKTGHTVGLHSWDHVMVTKYKNQDDWKKEMTDPKNKLEKIVEKPVEYWAYPDGVFNHQSAAELSKYFKLSFILSTPRDPEYPLQTVRRMIVPERSPEKLLKSMRQTFHQRTMTLVKH